MIKQEDVIKTLLFLDIFDYPPTAMELWRFLGVPAELGEVAPLLSKESPSFPRRGWGGSAGGGSGFCHAAVSRQGTAAGGGAFLSQSEATRPEFAEGDCDMAKNRREFVFLSEKKFKIARRAAKILKFIPSIKMIAVCNNFYYREESDVDFLIITSAKRLWLTRFFATIILDILHLRARGKKTADRICLSFYISENNLNLEDVALKSPLLFKEGSGGGFEGDPCLACWLAFMEPIYGYDTYEKFWQANNLPDSWFKKIFPNAELRCPPNNRRVRDNIFSIIIKKIGGIIIFGGWGNFLEKIVEKIQRLKLSPRVKELAAQENTNVVLDERMLKFHEEDDRENFRNKLNIAINLAAESRGGDSTRTKG
jgi:hypothetical protein